MKKLFTLLIITLCIFSCKEKNMLLKDSDNEFAKNFSLEYINNQLHITSAGNKTIFPANFTVKKCVITGTSASAYIDALGKFNTIAGICTPNYYYNPKIAEGIKNKIIQDVGNDASLYFEKIISLKPDLIITTHNPNYEKVLNQLSKTGIKIIYVEEYRELHPLGKTEYLKLFGALFNAHSKGDSLYNAIKNRYSVLKNKIKNSTKKPSIFTNIMYGDSWYIAGGGSFVATLFSDAGADYIWKDSPQTGTIPVSFEEVFSNAKNADFWIGASNFSTKKELLGSNPHYEWFKAFRDNKIYTMNAREDSKQANDYYESGSIYADLTLADIIKILYPEKLPNYNLTYLKQLN